jgi:hypothetical protein
LFPPPAEEVVVEVQVPASVAVLVAQAVQPQVTRMKTDCRQVPQQQY